jgi:hypothetical protein
MVSRGRSPSHGDLVGADALDTFRHQQIGIAVDIIAIATHSQ